MRQILHILTRQPDSLTDSLTQVSDASEETAREIVPLTDPVPDYHALVRKIFAADSVAVD